MKKKIYQLSVLFTSMTLVMGLFINVTNQNQVEAEDGEKSKNEPVQNEYYTVIDENGDVWNAYHARPGVEGARSSGIRRVHFDIDGMPVLDLTEERDLRDEYKQVTTKLRIR